MIDDDESLAWQTKASPRFLTPDRSPFLSVDRIGDIRDVECNVRVSFGETFTLGGGCDDQAAAGTKRRLPGDRLDPGERAVSTLEYRIKGNAHTVCQPGEHIKPRVFIFLGEDHVALRTGEDLLEGGQWRRGPASQTVNRC